MIQPQELRTGNWVSHIHNRTVAVKGIHPSGHYVFIHCLKEGADKYAWREVSEFEYIPLTEEILLKCGFEKKAGKTSIFELGIIRIWLGSKGVGIAYLITKDNSALYIPNQVQHLHQLQNLLFTLTGRELDIKL